VPAAWARHPVMRLELHACALLDVVVGDDALVVLRALDDGGAGLWGLGTPDGVAHLLLGAPQLAAGVVRSSLPRGTTAAASALVRGSVERLPAHLRTEPVSRWDWFTATTDPPAQPGESRVVGLDGRDGRAAARALLDRANPAAELDPHDPVTRWWGWKDDAGVVRGVGGARGAGPGVPWVLGGIATDPAARGRGIARAVTAAATRAGLRGTRWSCSGCTRTTVRPGGCTSRWATASRRRSSPAADPAGRRAAFVLVRGVGRALLDRSLVPDGDATFLDVSQPDGGRPSIFSGS
jgi:ribosomal protein S18 acetylase RimI-like enzyme